AQDELTAVIEITEYSSIFPGGFSLASFGIMSPTTLEAIEGAEITGEEGNYTLPEHAQEAGTLAGTGAFTVEEWNQDQNEVTLQRFDDYWGEPAGFETIILRAIPDETARRQALEAGDIHGYDLVAPQTSVPSRRRTSRCRPVMCSTSSTWPTSRRVTRHSPRWRSVRPCPTR